MKKILLLLFIVCAAFQVNAAQQLNLKDIIYGAYYAKNIQPPVSSADGNYFFQANNKHTAIIKYSYKTGQPVDTVFNVKKARQCTIDSFEGFVMSPDENRLLVYTNAEQVYRRSFKATYYYYDIRRNLIRPLTENKDKQSIPTFSHDGRMAAFVVDNNIWLAKFDYGSESQVTKDGCYGKIINGGTDWVYEEEFETTRIMDFSADNKLLAFVKFDESNVPQYSFQVYKDNLYPKLFTFKYPKTGQENSKVSCQVFDIEAMTTRKMNIPAHTEYIPRIQFLPQGDELAVMTLNRDQNKFDLYFANGRTSVARSILHEENDCYVDSQLFPAIRFFGNEFTYLSEKDGYTHIYLYDDNGVLKKQLTKGNYDVTDLLAVNPTTKTVFYQAAKESPMQRAIYKLNMVNGKEVKLTLGKGTNNAVFSNNGSYFINKFTNTTTPSIITVNDANGKQLRVLEDNKALAAKLKATDCPHKEFITVKAADGQSLNAYIMKPVNFDANRKYPLVMVQYSGPNSQQVLDVYGMDWTDYLTTQGFIVACVDGRGTGARGEKFRKCTYMNLGQMESDDQAAAARQFAKLPYIDGKKIAIWGWSYGGYMTLMSMSRGNGIFKAGVAIAPVTDWKFYDSVYGERYMRTPQENPAGYKAGSPIELANKLQGNLLLIHGTADDNVHFENSIDYVHALIKAGKQFDMFVFPDKNHSILGADNRYYLFQKVVHFLKTSM